LEDDAIYIASTGGDDISVWGASVRSSVTILYFIYRWGTFGVLHTRILTDSEVCSREKMRAPLPHFFDKIRFDAFGSTKDNQKSEADEMHRACFCAIFMMLLIKKQEIETWQQ
jgi:hypothetical protein